MVRSFFSACDTFHALVKYAIDYSAAVSDDNYLREEAAAFFLTKEMVHAVFFNTLETISPLSIPSYVVKGITIDLGIDFSSFDTTRQVGVRRYEDEYGENTALEALSRYEDHFLRAHRLLDAENTPLKSLIVPWAI